MGALLRAGRNVTQECCMLDSSDYIEFDRKPSTIELSNLSIGYCIMVISQTYHNTHQSTVNVAQLFKLEELGRMFRVLEDKRSGTMERNPARRTLA